MGLKNKYHTVEYQNERLLSSIETKDSSGVYKACLWGANAAGPIEGTHPISMAAYEGKIYIAQILIYFGASVNIYTRIGRSPLGTAILNQKESMALYLMRQGAEINKVSVDGRYDVHNAVKFGLNRVFRRMIKNGVDIDFKDDHGLTPMDYAYMYHRHDIREYIMHKKRIFI